MPSAAVLLLLGVIAVLARLPRFAVVLGVLGTGPASLALVASFSAMEGRDPLLIYALLSVIASLTAPGLASHGRMQTVLSRAGLCRCGYDLRALPPDQPCPECGAVCSAKSMPRIGGVAVVPTVALTIVGATLLSGLASSAVMAASDGELLVSFTVAGACSLLCSPLVVARASEIPRSGSLALGLFALGFGLLTASGVWAFRHAA